MPSQWQCDCERPDSECSYCDGAHRGGDRCHSTQPEMFRTARLVHSVLLGGIRGAQLDLRFISYFANCKWIVMFVLEVLRRRDHHAYGKGIALFGSNREPWLTEFVLPLHI